MIKFLNNTCPRISLSGIGLKTKLLIMMLALCITSIGLLFILYQIAEKKLITSVKKYTEELSSAIQISVEQMTAEDGEGNEETLKEYVSQFKKKGVREISILNNGMEVIASSNPKKIGQVIDAKTKRGAHPHDGSGSPEVAHGDSAASESQRSYDIILPVVVGYEQLGYIHISMRFDDFANLLRANNQKRLIATSIVFGIGIAVSIFLSIKYVKPINNLAQATQRIAAGDLQEIPETNARDEIGDLTRNFNEMVKGLRENKRLEERLMAAEHLSKIGQLASGIAHEIRNPLNFINLSIDHLRKEYQPEDHKKAEELHSMVLSIKTEISRLNSMIGNFLDYGKPLTLKLEKVFVEDIIKEALAIAEHMIREQKLELKTDYSKDIPAIILDIQQIKACFLNIILNAIQAMPCGGRLSVTTSHTSGFAVVKIEDTGDGIAEEHLAKVFEPYFTTKTAGIGLGLALTKRVIEEHKGRIDIESKHGDGAIVSVELPVAPL
ncbi:MAG: HAMP domain-containing protein [Deltaproteobacteria bacterium]|nr:HAMP domain-containing protein [Deltaproteobacteria bacterium]